MGASRRRITADTPAVKASDLNCLSPKTVKREESTNDPALKPVK
jgi:hypothetical protein